MMSIRQVYMIRHNVTGRMYIGRSNQSQTRIKHHFQLLRSGKHPVEDMQKDFDDYGDDYTVSMLGDVENHCLRLEIEMMEKYQSTVRGIGYNYKDPTVTARTRSTKKRSAKTKIRKLIESLDENQALYVYTFLSKMFGEGEV